MTSKEEALFSCVIPLVQKHDYYLADIFKTLSREQTLICEVIVSRSELHESQLPDFRANLMDTATRANLRCPIVLCYSPQKRNAAQNRNAGADVAKGDWITFLDADDDYSPNRLSTLSKYTDCESKPNLLAHSYSYQEEAKNMGEINYSGPLIQLTQSGARGSTNLEPVLESLKDCRIHHGHLTVRNEIYKSVKFSIDHPGSEDGIFCTSIAKEYGSVFLIPAPLSIYRVERSATNISKPRRLIKKLVKIGASLIRS